MNSKEKAQQLIYAFEAFTDKDNELEFAKQCALIACDEVLEHCYEVMKPFWEEVKIEIEKL